MKGNIIARQALGPPTRRDVLKSVGTGALAMGVVGAKSGASLIVETTGGRVRGMVAAGHIAFRGIRYATAERFMAPRAVVPHAGIVDAVDYGAIAPQTNLSPTGPSPLILSQLPRPAGVAPAKPIESEDCLFLNIWTASLGRSAKKPVMVWLHGGFFSSGSGNSGDGGRLAARGDVVVVSLNHRVNAFGFSHLADLAGADFARSGNVGMLDVVMALRWVRANIAAFGGDPSRIMVFGTSGGGMKTGWLLASPAAKGLIARAGVQSGPALRMMERDRASIAAEMLLTEAGLNAARANDLRRLPVAALLSAYFRVADRLQPQSFTDLPSFAPVLDPILLPHHPFDPTAPAQSRSIPLLIGSNADEMSFFMGADLGAFTLDEAGLAARSRALLGNKAEAAIIHYRARYPELSAARLWLRMFSDEQIGMPVLLEADRKAEQGGAPVFCYRLDWQSPALDGRLGATHTIENALIFDQRENALTGNSTVKDRLARRMGDAWVRFAATGRPDDDWPSYDADRIIMRINDAWQPERDPFSAERSLLSG